MSNNQDLFARFGSWNNFLLPEWHYSLGGHLQTLGQAFVLRIMVVHFPSRIYIEDRFLDALDHQGTKVEAKCCNLFAIESPVVCRISIQLPICSHLVKLHNVFNSISSFLWSGYNDSLIHQPWYWNFGWILLKLKWTQHQTEIRLLWEPFLLLQPPLDQEERVLYQSIHQIYFPCSKHFRRAWVKLPCISEYRSRYRIAQREHIFGTKHLLL